MKKLILTIGALGLLGNVMVSNNTQSSSRTFSVPRQNIEGSLVAGDAVKSLDVTVSDPDFIGGTKVTVTNPKNGNVLTMGYDNESDGTVDYTYGKASQHTLEELQGYYSAALKGQE